MSTGGEVSDESTTNAVVESGAVDERTEPVTAAPAEVRNSPITMRPLETLNSVELPVTVELGRTRLLIKELLSLRPGSVVELDRHVGAPVDVFVNSTLLAHGEVVVVDDELGVRITAIAGGTDDTRGA